MTGRLLIGALAARTGRSVHTIRWYEAQGLIPGVARDAGGRRVYTEQHVGWLLLMERLRATGMSIAAMREYADLVRQGKATLVQRAGLLRSHRERVQRTLAEWQDALVLLDAKIDFYDQWLADGKRPAFDPAPLPPRHRTHTDEQGQQEADAGPHRRTGTR
ncbi:MerR family transcriptional regulator [Aquabacterium sp. A7-Y]|uniref:MerR family transcriptional regulator n=1 Tax=Aquabacterium sp. A7-Y TaxID=1349605 RepID=UPI00223D4F59|nr:MerR family transcriptional regulator [Aquabacterium sp. A7-Y]MCW7541954.1 MerR family transcriptional regulator [Aquabacterium sp. A7-Y]